MDEESNKYLLGDDGRACERETYRSTRSHVTDKMAQPKSSRVMKAGLIASCLINITLITTLVVVTNPLLLQHGRFSVSIPSSSGLEYNEVSTYRHHTTYWSTNTTLADQQWDSLSTDPMVVAIPDTWAQQHRLPPTARWPWDHTRGRYFIRAYHDLHCLKYVRRYITDHQRGKPETLNGVHALHCLDALRQSTMCRADDTLMPTSDDTTFAIGDHQTMTCRSWDRLSAWALEPARNACHRSLSDYKAIHHSVERYAFCPADSPYKAVADTYFKEHGHQDPWG